MNENLFFIGAGMMAEGIIKGLTKNKLLNPEQIAVYDILENRMIQLNSIYGVNYYPDIEKGIKNSKYIFVAVKPNDVKSVAKLINKNLNNDAIIISIAAGITIDTLEEYIGKNIKIVRVMPNPLIEATNGVSAVCYNESVTKDDYVFIEEMLNTIGLVAPIQEEMFDAFTGYCCSGGAYVYEFIEAMIDAGVLVGFSRPESTKFTIENVIGAAKMVSLTGLHPCILKERMTSPAGTTITGLSKLNEAGLKSVVQKGVVAAVDKSKSMK